MPRSFSLPWARLCSSFAMRLCTNSLSRVIASLVEVIGLGCGGAETGSDLTALRLRGLLRMAQRCNFACCIKALAFMPIEHAMSATASSRAS